MARLLNEQRAGAAACDSAILLDFGVVFQPRATFHFFSAPGRSLARLSLAFLGACR